MPSLLHSHSLRSLAVAALSGLALVACSSLRVHRNDDSLAMAGNWILDRAASDDVTRLVDARMKRLQPRRRSQRLAPGEVPPLEDPDDRPADDPQGGPGGTPPAGSAGAAAGGSPPGGGGSGGGGPGGTMNQRLMRDQLLQALTSPQRLSWQFNGDSVQLQADDEPVRVLDAGQSAARFDASGAATISSGWDGRSFVVQSRYVNGQQRTERYTLSTDGATLQVQHTFSGSQLGKLAVHSLYRRGEPAALKPGR